MRTAGRAARPDAAVVRALGRCGDRALDAVPTPRGPVRYATATLGLDMQQPAASPTRKGGETAG
ncbi:hypothetical protein QFZ76_002142 [Streptomyces sp. V4I2]|nr:hypothetical protein [Streptomyces sp. V4I2]